MRAALLGVLYLLLNAHAADRSLDAILTEAELTTDRAVLRDLRREADAAMVGAPIIRSKRMVARVLLARAPSLNELEAQRAALQTARLLDPSADVSHLNADLLAEWNRLTGDKPEEHVFVVEPPLPADRVLFVDGSRVWPDRPDEPVSVSNPYRVVGSYHVWQVSGPDGDTRTAEKSEVRILDDNGGKTPQFTFAVDQMGAPGASDDAVASDDTVEIATVAPSGGCARTRR
jgi:hypothetical protein